MRPHQRREEIVKLVNARGEISVDDLADALGVSKETVRRDLGGLDAIGRVHKFHGGARTPSTLVPDPSREGPFAARMSENLAGKRSIARAAAGLLVPGDSLFIDTGTTTLLFAEALSGLSNLTIITNSTRIASTVSTGSDHKVFLLGGAYSADAAETLGAQAVEQIQRLRAKYAFLTVGAVDHSGLYDFDERETQVAQAMIERVDSVTVLADGSKYTNRGVFELAPWSKVSRFVTDQPPPSKTAAAMQAEGVELLLHHNR